MKGTYPSREVAEISKSHLRSNCATFAIRLCPLLQTTAAHATLETTMLAGIQSYHELFLFRVVLLGRAFLTVLMFLLQQVLLVTLPAQPKIIHSSIHVCRNKRRVQTFEGSKDQQETSEALDSSAFRAQSSTWMST